MITIEIILDRDGRYISVGQGRVGGGGEIIESWLDLAAGLGLISSADISERIYNAMIEYERTGDAENIKHITAVAIAAAVGRGEGDVKWMAEYWQRLAGEEG